MEVWREATNVNQYLMEMDFARGIWNFPYPHWPHKLEQQIQQTEEKLQANTYFHIDPHS